MEFADDFAHGHVQGREQPGGAMSLVVVGAPLGLARPHGQAGSVRRFHASGGLFLFFTSPHQDSEVCHALPDAARYPRACLMGLPSGCQQRVAAAHSCAGDAQGYP